MPIDTVMTKGAGLPLGPFALLDVVGNDVSLAIEQVLHSEFRLLADKRTTLEFVIDHLVKQAPAKPDSLPLPAGAPFGTVSVADACTLCMACTSACPAGALKAAADAPRRRAAVARAHVAAPCYCRSRRFNRRSVGFFQAVRPATPNTAQPPTTTAGTSPSSRAMVPA